jgi:uncharacterized protein (TIGR00369 family)
MTDDDLRRVMTDAGHLSPCTALLGFELIDFSADAGWATMSFTSTPQMMNPIGSLQGGIVAAMLDDGMGIAARLHTRLQSVVPTLALNTVYVRPTPIGRVLVRGQVDRIGRTTAILSGRLTDVEGTLLATATATAAVRAAPHRELT